MDMINFHFDLGLLTPCTMDTTSDISGLSVDVSTISFLNIFFLQSNIQVWGFIMLLIDMEQKKYYLKINIIYVLFVNHIFANGHKEILKILIRTLISKGEQVSLQ
ncbi:hypothetical protein ACJX0J_017385 [Zea mays]